MTEHRVWHTLVDVSLQDVSVMTPLEKKDGDVTNEGLSSMVRYQGWREIEVTIDSGACDCAMPISRCSGIIVEESEQRMQTLKYE